MTSGDSEKCSGFPKSSPELSSESRWELCYPNSCGSRAPAVVSLVEVMSVKRGDSVLILQERFVEQRAPIILIFAIEMPPAV